ncbi:putative hydrolase/acyltransferase (alpha/beta hydrolase superfamily) [Handroanthus impetiginosus]|uniref:Putative hydrolase/acyltransferase (Alpha/beta hydrolase superfamily) n=1 Tax=Handroanthus impetiginosus TaxID=429701 RepID=A0A2G9FVC5_9LAMI|nr:putative hydrolase/acyltransferase (alpha/beta hydrolase superfamily) [Handroanthus impetiginosus]
MMENILCRAAKCCYVVNFGGVKGSNQQRSKLPTAREKRFSSVVIESSFASSKYFHLYSLSLKRLRQIGPSTTVCSLNRNESPNPSVVSETHNSYVLDGEEGISSTTGGSRSIPKVLIPSLPDEEHAAPISSCFWEWRPKLNVHYEVSGSENVNSPPILFLPGFGVGSFHYEKQLEDLGRDYRTWALDFLGQGMSLPREDPTLRSKDGKEYILMGQNESWGFGDESETWAKELVYSVDLWRDQVKYFIEEVIKEPVYLVGNSLGGFVALYFAASNPHLVKGVTLLNATPFWGFLPNPERSPRLSKLFPWAGTFPLPSGVRKLIELLWEKISDPTSIAEVLKQVYADHSTDVDELFSRIIQTTQHPAAAASLASIMFAPRGHLSFNEALSKCKMNNVPICLTYGKEDPWVMPIFGLRVKKQVPDAPYYEISPAGHCPHDEVPEVNFLPQRK